MTAGRTAAERQLFAPAIAAALVAAGILSFLFYVVFAAYAPDPSGDTDGRANALSRSAVGFAAFAELLRQQGVPVIVSRGLSDVQYARASLIIFTPSLAQKPNDVIAVTPREPKLVVLPKWSVIADQAHPGWVAKLGLYPERLFGLDKSTTLTRQPGAAPVDLHNGLHNTDTKTGAIESLQTIAGPGWTNYVTVAHGHALVSRLPNTGIYVLSEPDLLNTQGIRDLANAKAGAEIVQSLRKNNGPVVFDVTLAGYRRSPNFLRLIFEPPLLGATLCALAAALLMAVHAAVRFGAPEKAGRVFALGKYALVDNSAALIALARREHRVVLRYAAAIRHRVARFVGITDGHSEAEISELLDRLQPRNAGVQRFSEMFEQAGKARSQAEALNVARKLYRWGEVMIHGR